MKPTSIVFMVIAALLIVGGLITCSVAKDVALTDGYTLFHDAEEGGTSVVQEIPDDISKLELVFTDADVHIYGGADESYVEFRNFREGLYTLTASGKIISFDEIPSLNSLLNFKKGFSFSGLRYFLHGGFKSTGPKEINVYISAASTMKVLSVSCTSGTVTADQVVTQFDVIVNAENKVTLDLTQFRTACALDVEASEIHCSMSSGYLNSLRMSCKQITADCAEIFFNNVEIEANTGDINLSAPTSLTPYAYNVVSADGSLTIQGAETALPYLMDAASEKSGRIDIQGKSLHITLTEVID